MLEVELRGGRFSYEVLGSEAEAKSAGRRTPMVWGHGLTSSRADEDRQPLIDSSVIARDRRVLRYDARGHGFSSDLRTPGEGDWAALALDQIAFIDHLGWGDVILGGASMGTATALHAALTLGDRVKALVLVIPPTAWESRAAQVDLYDRMASAVEGEGTDLLVAAAKAMPPPDPFVGDDEWLDRRITLLETADPVRFAAGFRGAATADLPSQAALSTLDIPTLVLAWSGDPGHPVSTAERLGSLIAGAEVVVSSTRDDLDTWTARCAAFLDGR